MNRTIRLLAAALVGTTIGAAVLLAPSPATWSPKERETLRSLWIGSLPALPPDPSNQYGDDPAAAALGHRLFFDTRLSANGLVSCATCHKPGRDFQDDLPLANGVGRTAR
ncbi:MAG TPA: cytochrome c peroxidase, partial [Rhodothermales bacterium]|nr:cytochrome c peroxidase [Rhodothermales bacterium]